MSTSDAGAAAGTGAADQMPNSQKSDIKAQAITDQNKIAKLEQKRQAFIAEQERKTIEAAAAAAAAERQRQIERLRVEAAQVAKTGKAVVGVHKENVGPLQFVTNHKPVYNQITVPTYGEPGTAYTESEAAQVRDIQSQIDTLLGESRTPEQKSQIQAAEAQLARDIAANEQYAGRSEYDRKSAYLLGNIQSDIDRLGALGVERDVRVNTTPEGVEREGVYTVFRPGAKPNILTNGLIPANVTVNYSETIRQGLETGVTVPVSSGLSGKQQQEEDKRIADVREKLGYVPETNTHYTLNLTEGGAAPKHYLVELKEGSVSEPRQGRQLAISLAEGRPNTPKKLTQDEVNALSEKEYAVYESEFEPYNKFVKEQNILLKQENLAAYTKSKNDLLTFISQEKAAGTKYITIGTATGPKVVPIDTAYHDIIGATNIREIAGTKRKIVAPNEITGIAAVPNIPKGYTLAGTISDPVFISEGDQLIGPVKPKQTDYVKNLAKLVGAEGLFVPETPLEKYHEEPGRLAGIDRTVPSRDISGTLSPVIGNARTSPVDKAKDFFEGVGTGLLRTSLIITNAAPEAAIKSIQNRDINAGEKVLQEHELFLKKVGVGPSAVGALETGLETGRSSYYNVGELTGEALPLLYGLKNAFKNPFKSKETIKVPQREAPEIASKPVLRAGKSIYQRDVIQNIKEVRGNVFVRMKSGIEYEGKITPDLAKAGRMGDTFVKITTMESKGPMVTKREMGLYKFNLGSGKAELVNVGESGVAKVGEVPPEPPATPASKATVTIKDLVKTEPKTFGIPKTGTGKPPSTKRAAKPGETIDNRLKETKPMEKLYVEPVKLRTPNQFEIEQAKQENLSHNILKNKLDELISMGAERAAGRYNPEKGMIDRLYSRVNLGSGRGFFTGGSGGTFPGGEGGIPSLRLDTAPGARFKVTSRSLGIGHGDFVSISGKPSVIDSDLITTEMMDNAFKNLQKTGRYKDFVPEGIAAMKFKRREFVPLGKGEGWLESIKSKPTLKVTEIKEEGLTKTKDISKGGGTMTRSRTQPEMLIAPEAEPVPVIDLRESIPKNVFRRTRIDLGTSRKTWIVKAGGGGVGVGIPSIAAAPELQPNTLVGINGTSGTGGVTPETPVIVTPTQQEISQAGAAAGKGGVANMLQPNSATLVRLRQTRIPGLSPLSRVTVAATPKKKNRPGVIILNPVATEPVRKRGFPPILVPANGTGLVPARTTARIPESLLVPKLIPKPKPPRRPPIFLRWDEKKKRGGGKKGKKSKPNDFLGNVPEESVFGFFKRNEIITGIARTQKQSRRDILFVRKKEGLTKKFITQKQSHILKAKWPGMLSKPKKGRIL